MIQWLKFFRCLQSCFWRVLGVHMWLMSRWYWHLVHMPLAESSNSCNHLLILIVLRYSCQWHSCHCLLLCRNITLNFGMLQMEEICILCQVVPGCVQLPLVYQTHLFFCDWTFRDRRGFTRCCYLVNIRTIGSGGSEEFVYFLVATNSMQYVPSPLKDEVCMYYYHDQ